MGIKEKQRVNFPKERLLDEAEALFAAKGYHGVSVREITQAAGCNLASINYHFGNKQNLYLEVFKTRWIPRAMRIREYVREVIAAHRPPSPAELIEAVAKAFLGGPLSDEERRRHQQLMFRELNRPSEAFELVAEKVMRPFSKELMEVLRPCVPGDLSEEQLLLCILSIFGMVLYFSFAQVAVSRITGRQYDSGFRSRLIAHIVQFSLGGLKLTGSGE